MRAKEKLILLQRRARVLERLDAGHKALHDALEGIDPDDAFLGSRWSVWEVVNHLDAEGYVEALELIASGKKDMLPPFTSREEKLKKDIAHLDETFLRFRALVAGLTEERMAQPVTPPNPHNSFPGLTFLELVERSSGHETTHARQIVETRRYVEAFSSKERTVTFLALNPEGPSELGVSAIGLLKHADYVAGAPEALDAVRNFAGGAELTLNGRNTEEVISQLDRETRAGLWAVICTIGSPSECHIELLHTAEKHCGRVVIQQAGQ